MAERGFKTRCENISEELRQELGLRKSAPLAAEDLAKHLGVFLWEPSDIKGLSKDSIRLLTRWGDKSWSALAISVGEAHAIIYNPAHIKGRRSIDIMHELSHILLVHEPSQLMVSPNTPYVLRSYNKEMEDEATWLAGCLLLP